MRVRLFGRNECPACAQARAKIEYFARHWRIDLPLEYISLDTPDGMAEGALNDVYEVPTMILERDGAELQRWLKFPPRYEELKTLLDVPDPT